jgi:hypothetical protein
MNNINITKLRNNVSETTSEFDELITKHGMFLNRPFRQDDNRIRKIENTNVK